MFYTDEGANQLLNYSKILVDQMNKNKSCPSQLKSIQYIVFAGMLSYYGFEYVDTIYKAFNNSKFFYTTDSVEKFMKDRGLHDSTIERAARTGEVGAFVCLQYSRDFNRRLVVDRDVYIIENKMEAPDFFLEKVIHEINHVVNSINNPICLKSGQEVIRNGLGLLSVNSDFRVANVLEESVNVLQSAEIMDHILAFTQCDIVDPEIKRTLDKVKYAYTGSKRDGIGYEYTVPTVRPLYQNPSFNKVVKRQRMIGRIVPIREEFESRVGEGTYNDFCSTLEEIELHSNSYWTKPFYEMKASQFVKRYNKSM